MKFNRWELFVRVVKFVSVPLALLTFYFYRDERFGWIGNLCLIILFSFGLIGGIRGLIVYGFRRQPLPLADHVEQIRRGYSDKMSPTHHKAKGKIILLTVFLFLAVLSEIYFVWGVFYIANIGSGIEFGRNSSFFLEKAGSYTLWESWSDQNTPITTETARQFQIKRVDNNEAVPRQSLFSRAEYRRNGELFTAICNYSFSAPGSYRLLMPDDQKSNRLLLKRSISISIIGSTFASFFIGVLFVILGWYTFSAKRANKLQPSS